VLDTNQASPGALIAPHLNVTVSWNEFVTQVTRTRDGLCLTCGQTRPGRGNCPAPGLMETSKTRRIGSYVGTTEVPRRVA
jgi:hypothetical protein